MACEICRSENCTLGNSRYMLGDAKILAGQDLDKAIEDSKDYCIDDFVKQLRTAGYSVEVVSAINADGRKGKIITALESQEKNK